MEQSRCSRWIEQAKAWSYVPPAFQIDCHFREDRAEQLLAWAGLLYKGQSPWQNSTTTHHN